ncbi:glycosyltransferase family 4 protein [uncultured Pseudokineococcus sp.]|uniref:glycosyltransferase family 4 protein n=1 Tax=uncultured Pseudokineococcus sp. TaxID=1642928 RepID=UPI002628D857|nr:glycosyltransferase family 4 protein [uncultured Pseudokineococcus sp.]
MRVVLVAGHATGGIAGHVAELAEGLAGAGVHVVVATSAATADRWDRLAAAARAVADLERDEVPGAGEETGRRGVPVLRLWPHPRRPLEALRRLRHLRRLLRDADVVHAHGHQAGVLAVLLAGGGPGRRAPRGDDGARRRPAVVVTWHNAVLGSPRSASRRLLAVAERLQARGADLLTGASGDLVDRAADLGARGPQVTPVAVPDRAADGGRERGGPVPAPPPAGLEDLAPGTLVVLTVSRLAPQKDLPTLVRAAARLRGPGGDGGPPVVWCVVGDGEPGVERGVRRLVAELGAPVRLLGARSDVPALLARADVFALASTWEARSLAVQEAMAAGLPVVAPRTGGLPDLLEGVGSLVPVGDDRALAGAVAALLEDPVARERAGRASREAFTALPGPQDVLRGWLDRYARLAAERGGASPGGRER